MLRSCNARRRLPSAGETSLRVETIGNPPQASGMETPTAISTDQLLRSAREAAEAGAAVIRPVFRPGRTQRSAAKSVGVSYDLVTETDVAAEKAITSVLSAAFPTHAVLGEEGEADRSTGVLAEAEPHLWIVDPIDGTNNFAHGVPHFAVSVASYCRGEPMAGVVLNPATGDEYAAAAGRGATRNGVPIRVDAADSLADCLVGCGFYYDRGPMMRATLAAIEEVFSHHVHGIRRMGTASLDICQVACGMYGGFFEFQLSPWDWAAARVVLTEAGGRMTTAQGEALPLARSSVLASNGSLHEPLLAITRRHHP